jgi:hypothetical protein
LLLVRSVKYISLLILCATLLTHVVCAQHASTKNRYSRSKLGYKTPKVRGSKAKTICPVFETSGYPYHAIGFKVGDPLALSYKYYPSKRFSFVVDFGKASSGLYNRYDREKFAEYVSEGIDTLSDNSSLSYSFHRVKADWVGEAKVLYQFEANKLAEGLQVYAGGGWEWKETKVSYDYFYNKTDPNGGNLVNEFRKTERNRFTMGPQVVLGIEYSYFQLPLSAFMEVEYFVDVHADPGWKKFEGGVGLRYVF